MSKTTTAKQAKPYIKIDGKTFATYVPNKLLSTNTKLDKSVSGFKLLGLQLAPAKESGYNVCPNASKGCAAACLWSSGLGRMPAVIKGRINKTKLFFEQRESFMLQLENEIQLENFRAKQSGEKLAVRLNTISDLSWESIKCSDGKNLFEKFPDIVFYDYTKNPRRALDWGMGKMPLNYHLTFSRSESNEEQCKIILANGGNVAVVFRDKLPKTYLGKKVVSGDESDARFLDEKNVVVGLTAKGKGKTDKSGFIVR